MVWKNEKQRHSMARKSIRTKTKQLKSNGLIGCRYCKGEGNFYFDGKYVKCGDCNGTGYLMVK